MIDGHHIVGGEDGGVFIGRPVEVFNQDRGEGPVLLRQQNAIVGVAQAGQNAQVDVFRPGLLKGDSGLVFLPPEKIPAGADHLGKMPQLFAAHVLGPLFLKLSGQVDQRHSGAGVVIQKRGHVSLPALIIQAEALQIADGFRGGIEQLDRITAQRVGGDVRFFLLPSLGLPAVELDGGGPGGKSQPIFYR